MSCCIMNAVLSFLPHLRQYSVVQLPKGAHHAQRPSPIMQKVQKGMISICYYLGDEL